jgi:cell division septum initiation protein DivIVA
MASVRPEDLTVSALPRTALGHLKADAVADLLQRAAWDLREALARNQQLTNTVEELSRQVEELAAEVASLEEAAARRKDPDELARSLLASAQRSAREERESARQECELMLKKAASRAERMEEESARRAEARISELARLEELREEVVRQFRSTLKAIADPHDDTGSLDVGSVGARHELNAVSGAPER